MVVAMMNVSRLAQALNVPVHELFGLQPMDDGPVHWKRSEYAAEARKRLGASVAEMSDGIGFHEVFVTALENFSGLLELYPFKVTAIVARYLEVPPQHLLGRIPG